jgi:DNA gyrase subunit B
MAVVTALSERLDLEIRRDGKAWSQRYQLGKAQGPLAPLASASSTGTTIRFRPDPTILERQFDADDLRVRLASLAAELPQTSFVLVDERSRS